LAVQSFSDSITESNELNQIHVIYPSRLIQTKSRLSPSETAKNQKASCDVTEFGECNRVIFFVLKFWILGRSEKKANAKNGGEGEIASGSCPRPLRWRYGVARGFAVLTQK